VETISDAGLKWADGRTVVGKGDITDTFYENVKHCEMSGGGRQTGAHQLSPPTASLSGVFSMDQH